MPTASISVLGNVLTVNQADTYQWYLNGVLISGATNQAYTVTQSGDYTVQISVNNCVATSSILQYIYIALSDITKENMNFVIYPNPNNGLFNIAYNLPTLTDTEITISNVLGQIIFEQINKREQGKQEKQISLQAQSNGVYLVTIKTAYGNFTTKIIKQE